ncbi:DUF2505 domain-containing protein [Gordonia sp. HY002]|uniref:DUF2505 domain-containing protein n=1 Tax=Gordonia zhenghanii TaxID=2911516 RepID=UPI001EF0D7BE|nr:DUF2505 domain-containing protein [Gordonia zhenghanii]MCF8569036.1 DUF2505 domain-containing protein [Gordonia zhenghanii]MCF8605254.1 DUF2505 domain-containing protein [Gordonia zhenghanii]
MSSNFEHSVSYPFSVTDYWALITTEQYWRDLLAATNSDHGSLESFEIDGDAVTVATKQGVDESNLPKAVTAIRPGDLEIPRTCVFRLSGDTIIGRMEASVTGAPAKISGDIVITGAQATAQYTGAVDVAIPFVGGRVEKAVVEQVVHLLDAEHDATVDFHQG